MKQRNQKIIYNDTVSEMRFRNEIKASSFMLDRLFLIENQAFFINIPDFQLNSIPQQPPWTF